MEVIADVIFEMGSIILMGIVFFVLYVYGKLILIKIGLIDAEVVDESKRKMNQMEVCELNNLRN